MPVTPETLQQIADNRRNLAQLTDEQVRGLVTAWVETWRELEPEYAASIQELMADASDGYVSRAKVRANSRLKQSLEVTRANLERLQDAANLTITTALPEAVQLGGAGEAAVIASQLPAAGAGLVIAWDRVSPDAIAAIVERSTERIHAATKPIPADVERTMKRELIRGVSVGDSPRTTARRIVKRTEANFNFGLERALRISRTEMIDASRNGAHVAAQDNVDILTGWRWSAELSSRTCPSCISRHGTTYPVSKSGPDDHPQGRCARVDITKSWADLGFEGIEEPDDVFPDAKQWFGDLTEDTQVRIMGRERLDLLNSGSIGFDDLSTLKQNPNWRQSYAVTPVKKLRAKAA